jgi:hypothetical protein
LTLHEPFRLHFASPHPGDGRCGGGIAAGIFARPGNSGGHIFPANPDIKGARDHRRAFVHFQTRRPHGFFSRGARVE